MVNANVSLCVRLTGHLCMHSSLFGAPLRAPNLTLRLHSISEAWSSQAAHRRPAQLR